MDQSLHRLYTCLCVRASVSKADLLTAAQICKRGARKEKGGKKERDGTREWDEMTMQSQKEPQEDEKEKNNGDRNVCWADRRCLFVLGKVAVLRGVSIGVVGVVGS